MLWSSGVFVALTTRWGSNKIVRARREALVRVKERREPRVALRARWRCGSLVFVASQLSSAFAEVGGGGCEGVVSFIALPRGQTSRAAVCTVLTDPRLSYPTCRCGPSTCDQESPDAPECTKRARAWDTSGRNETMSDHRNSMRFARHDSLPDFDHEQLVSVVRDIDVRVY